MANPHNVKLEAAKFLNKLVQNCKDEPTKLATKLYVILQHMKCSGKEHSMPYLVISRAMKTLIQLYRLDIEALMPLWHPLSPGAQLGESGSSQVATKDDFAIFSPFYAEYEGILYQHGAEVVHFVSATSHAENVNNAEQNIDRIGEIEQLVDATNNTENMNTNVAEQNDSMEQRDTNSNISKNQRAIKRTERKYGITRAHLLQQSGKKQKEAAKYLGVSISTFKRIREHHQIFRWPPHNLKNDDHLSNTAQELIQTSEKIMEDSRVKDLPLPVKLVEQDLDSKPDSTQNAMTVQNGSNIMVKVTYRDDIIRLYFPVSSGKVALEKEIAKRFCLSIGSFSVKYLDEDEDWISVTCDADLKTCISLMRSLGKSTVKMLVNCHKITDLGK